jgi:hypothetical protein
MKLNLLLLSATVLVNAASAISPGEVLLGEAGDFVILAKSGISTVPKSAITGDIGVSPIAATAITGFGLTLATDIQSSTATQITGKAFAASYGGAIATKLTTAVSNMEAAYIDAAGRTPTATINDGSGTIPTDPTDATIITVGAIGSSTLTTGVYSFNTDIIIGLGTDVTFHGSATDVFIMQTTGVLSQAADTKVLLTGGALAENIFWQVAKNAKIAAGAHMEGVLLVKTDVLFVTGSSLNGRVLAQTAVNLQMATIVER